MVHLVKFFLLRQKKVMSKSVETVVFLKSIFFMDRVLSVGGLEWRLLLQTV